MKGAAINSSALTRTRISTPKPGQRVAPSSLTFKKARSSKNVSVAQTQARTFNEHGGEDVNAGHVLHCLRQLTQSNGSCWWSCACYHKWITRLLAGMHVKESCDWRRQIDCHIEKRRGCIKPWRARFKPVLPQAAAMRDEAGDVKGRHAACCAERANQPNQLLYSALACSERGRSVVWLCGHAGMCRASLSTQCLNATASWARVNRHCCTARHAREDSQHAEQVQPRVRCSDEHSQAVHIGGLSL